MEGAKADLFYEFPTANRQGIEKRARAKTSRHPRPSPRADLPVPTTRRISAPRRRRERAALGTRPGYRKRPRPSRSRATRSARKRGPARLRGSRTRPPPLERVRPLHDVPAANAPPPEGPIATATSGSAGRASRHPSRCRGRTVRRPESGKRRSRAKRRRALFEIVVCGALFQRVIALPLRKAHAALRPSRAPHTPVSARSRAARGPDFTFAPGFLTPGRGSRRIARHELPKRTSRVRRRHPLALAVTSLAFVCACASDGENRALPTNPAARDAEIAELEERVARDGPH